MFYKTGVLKISPKFAQKHLCRCLTKLPTPSLPIKKTQVFSYEFCEVFKNTFLVEHLRTAVSKTFQCANFNLNNAGLFEGNFFLEVNLTFIFQVELIQI